MDGDKNSHLLGNFILSVRDRYNFRPDYRLLLRGCLLRWLYVLYSNFIAVRVPLRLDISYPSNVQNASL